MTLPTFLGIGVMRGGSTWLHELLASHPDVYVPTRRKAILFFNLYYERGLEWYESFFPTEAEAGRYQAVGEITPTYVYDPDCPERIASVPSITKLLVSVRNPVNRVYSWYGLQVKNGQYSGSFEAFLSEYPQVIEHGFYSRYLENYYRSFDKEQILVLIYERATADIPETKDTLARCLGVAAERFPPDAGTERINRSYVPRIPFAYALANRIAWDYLRYRWDLDWVVNWGKRLGIERLFGEAGPLPSMEEETRKYLEQVYEEEIKELESLLQVDLDCWRADWKMTNKSGPSNAKQVLPVGHGNE
jgi:hypothetical protein